MPVAKIIGQKWFYGLSFATNRHTLDPRPDSETLVEAVLKGIENKEKEIRILDLGTGTGNLICALAANLPGAMGVGVDISGAAARMARRNVKQLGLADRVQIIRADFNKLGNKVTPPFDIIVSNPPYIATGDNRVDAGARFDPAMALYAGADGLDAYRAIAHLARPFLKPGGQIYLEIGAGQGPAVWKIFESNRLRYMGSHDDLTGTERVLVFKR